MADATTQQQDTPYTREQGVQAIIDLQKLAGIDEPRERAERNWDRFAPWERQATERVHRKLRPNATR